jgi:GDP-L-fucose synthase
MKYTKPEDCMKRDAKIFVAGHKGLVGSAVMRKLTALGYTNFVVRERSELDLRDQDAVDHFFEKEEPEYVFLAAAKVGGIFANNTYKAEFIYDNLAVAMNVVHASYRYGVTKLLNLGSSCIYPKFAPQPIKEESLLSGFLEPTNEPYAIAKIAAIKLCRYYNEQYGCNYLSVMPTNLYGPHDNFDLQTSHVLPALIRKFHLGKLLDNADEKGLLADLKKRPLRPHGVTGQLNSLEDCQRALAEFGIEAEKVTLWGTGSPYREFLHVDDLSEACISLMQSHDYGEIGELINIGSGTDQTIAELARMTREVVGYAGVIAFDATKPDGMPRKLLDVSRIKKLGWKSQIGLQEGMRTTYTWYVGEDS